MMSEAHNLAVSASDQEIVYLECSCGWLISRPGTGSDQYAPWSMREIVDISNSHLTAVTS